MWRELRLSVGTVAAKEKQGVKFKVRSAEDLIDKVRDRANELGLLIYPHEVVGKGHVVDSGTLAEVTVVVIAQAVEDGSRLAFSGFGLGADNQDKAGGKAGTYAFKQALIQALLAGGSKEAKKLGVVDTDDTDTPIAGGVRPVRTKAPTADEITAELNGANTRDQYTAAVKRLVTCPPDVQLSVRDAVVAAKARVA